MFIFRIQTSVLFSTIFFFFNEFRGTHPSMCCVFSTISIFIDIERPGICFYGVGLMIF